MPAPTLAQGVLGSTTQPGRAGRRVAEGRVQSPLLLSAGIQLLPSSNQEWGFTLGWWCIGKWNVVVWSIYLQAPQVFTEKVVKPWNRLPGEVVDVPSMSVHKRHLDSTLNNML